MLNRLKKAALKEIEERKNRAFEFIETGREGDTEAGLRYYSTDTRWDQYTAGTIDRARAVELAKKRAAKKYEKEAAEEVAKFEAVEAAPDIISLSINVEWHRSSVWGYNPAVEVTARDAAGHYFRTYGSASGCGYDKESAATAEALNQIDGLLKALYKIKNKAMKNGPTTSHDCITYGAGYGVRPYFEGGVGFGCHEHIINLAGLKTINRVSGNTYSNYFFAK